MPGDTLDQAVVIRRMLVEDKYLSVPRGNIGEARGAVKRTEAKPAKQPEATKRTSTAQLHNTGRSLRVPAHLLGFGPENTCHGPTQPPLSALSSFNVMQGMRIKGSCPTHAHVVVPVVAGFFIQL